jgi:2-keto-3-deoxy-L-rhamnonate aldolase RhmA
MYLTDSLNEKIKQGKTLYGTHIFCGSPMITEAISIMGFDMLWIDMEHTAIGIESLQNNLISAHSGGTPAFVRIPWNDMVRAKPVIDMGCDGIIFPYIRTAEEAAYAVASCEYPPKGIRGYGPLRALDYHGISQADFVDHVCRKMWRVIQIEHIDAADNLEEIAGVGGIDAYIVGPNDLSASVGHIGKITHPDMTPIYDRIGDVMRKYNKIFGVSTGFVPEEINRWLSRGAHMIFAGDDVSYIYEGAKKVLDGLNQL